MRKLVLAIAMYGMMWMPAQAGTITTTFDAWKANAVQIGDATFTYLGGGDNFNNDLILFTEDAFPDQTVYDLNIFFNPSLIDEVLDLDYSVTFAGASSDIVGLGVDSLIGALGTDFDVTRTYYDSANHVGQIAQLTSVNGSNESVLGSFGNPIFTHVTAVVPASNALQSFRDEYIHDVNGNPNAIIPEPASIALLSMGAFGLALSAYRKRRSRSL